MSVEIILSAKQIELDSNNLAVLNLKAIFTKVSPSTSALYKVRTNFKDMIDVRPSFGVLRANSEEDSLACLNIKYSGSMDDVNKMKIQVSWVEGNNVPHKKLGHSEFNELYKAFKANVNKEKNRMVQFTTQHLLKLSQQSIDSHQTSNASSETEVEQPIPEQKQPQIPLPQPVSQQQSKKKVGFKVLLVGILIAFGLGVLAGLRLERYLQKNYGGDRLEGLLSGVSFSRRGQDIEVAVGDGGRLQDVGEQQHRKESNQFQVL